MEFHDHKEKEYAGRGTTALGTVGTVLGSIGTAGATGLLNGLFGGGAVCSDNMPVNRYEQGLVQELAAAKQQIALRDSQVYTDQKLADVLAYVNGQISALNQAVAAQAVQNQKTEDAFALVGERIACCKNEFMAALCRERDERVCSDNTIVNYVNQTFYSKLIAGVTPTAETTAQTVYNPLPNCGCR